MLPRIPRCAAIVVVTALTLCTVLTPLSAQVRIPDAAREFGAVDDGQLQALLADGDKLERDRRWGEALNHYEDALRNYPNRVELQQRRNRSRVHYDLARRYADRSFVASLQSLSLEETLRLYGELLSKINTHHVDVPDWRGLVARGTFSLARALNDETFIKHNMSRVSPQQIGAFRAELDRNLAWRPIRNAREAGDAVNVAAQLAHARLGISTTAVAMEYIAGASGGLDTYSSYLTEDQLDDVFNQIEGNFVGLGIELKTENDVLRIINVIGGSPAEELGWRPTTPS